MNIKIIIITVINVNENTVNLGQNDRYNIFPNDSYFGSPDPYYLKP